MKLIKFAIFIILVLILVSCKSEESTQTPQTLPSEVLAEYDALKLVTTQDGMYKISLDDIGWDESIAESIAITHRGVAIPYWREISKSGSNLIFFGQASESIYTSDNAYFLLQNEDLAKPMDTNPMESGNSNENFVTSAIHSEENLLYSPKIEDGSPWHWSKIVAPKAEDLEIDIPNPAKEPGKIMIALWGVTSAPTNPDHHIQISVNQQVVGEAFWDEQAWYIFEAELPAGLLIDGINTVSIHATGETEARIDIIQLDWIEIEYTKQVENLENQEVFSLPAEAVRWAGIEDGRVVFEISNLSKISRLEPPEGNKNPLVLSGNPEKRYISVSPDGFLSPHQISPVVASPDLHTNNGADYIAIGHPSLLEPLSPLLDFRNQQGLSSLKVPAEAIYDQFNNGIAEPEAIQKFLKHALENWETPPRYVLLVGDTSYDFLGYQIPPEDHFLPTFLVPTVFGGETGSDVEFAQINEDEWPDLAIGRVPARSVQQVETFVNKTLVFEKNNKSENFSPDILAIADGQEATFKNDAENFLEQFPEIFPTHLIAPEAGAEETNREITAEIETGQFLTAYFGHGSVNMWGKDSLFTTEDSAALGNADHLPIMLNFTCLTGLFTHPKEESMAESLLFNPDGGAVAVLAPTSPTLPGDQTFLSNAFIEALLQEPTPRLGDIALFAWRAVPIHADSAIDVMRTFLLFGDPALLLPSP